MLTDLQKGSRQEAIRRNPIEKGIDALEQSDSGCIWTTQ
jgi:hypothetical protein